MLYKESFDVAAGARVFSVEYLPGQFDQRADSAVQCVKFLKEDEEPIIKSATTYVVEGDVTDEEFAAIKAHCINPVDSRETGMVKPETLAADFEEPQDVMIFEGFIGKSEEELKELYNSLGLAMTFKDFLHIRKYFEAEEKRNPSMTEIRVLDTYWSDHCRHTTFSTELKNVAFGEGYYKEPIVGTYEKYLADREEIFKGRDDKFVCLMDLALMAMRKLKKEGKLEDQEESDEINACSIVVPVEIDGETEEWLVNFKNETHNHPTEIEPFGGAATCLGGAIRDPLSGRTYVYQAMRVTGAADPTVSVKETMKTAAEEAGTGGRPRIQFLWKSDRAGDRFGKGNLSSELCGKKNGNWSSAWRGSAQSRDQGDFRSGRYHHPAGRTYRAGWYRRCDRFFQSTYRGVHRGVRGGSAERKCAY